MKRIPNQQQSGFIPVRRNKEVSRITEVNIKIPRSAKSCWESWGIANITGLIEAWANIVITWDWTTWSPYIISGTWGGWLDCEWVITCIETEGIWAEYITYDNTTSGLTAIDVQSAIDELVVELWTKIENITGLVTSWTAITITGSWTTWSPYVVNYSGWSGWINSLSLDWDTWPTQAIADWDTITIAWWTGIDTVASATDTITVNLNSASIASLALADTAVQTLTDLWITATASELNIMDWVTATTAEINYVDWVTSNIQTQLNSKLSNITWLVTAWSNVTITWSWTTWSPYVVNSSWGWGRMNSFTLAWDTWSQTISDWDTLSILWWTGIDTVVSATDTATISLDSSSIASLALADTALQNLSWLDTDDLVEWTTNHYYPQADETKVWYISITQAVDLDDIETRVNALDSAVVLKWTWDASAWTFPWWWTAQAGYSYIVSVAWTVDSVAFNVWDRIIAIADNASTTTFASNWFKADYTDQVSSVSWKTWVVTLVTADISDLTATAGELNVLDGITATTAELNYTDWVTSNIQTQLNNKVWWNATDNIGYLNIPQNKQNTAYGLVIWDAWKHIYHDDATARTYTIPANSSVSFPIWTAITFVNNWSGAVTIAITTDTMYLSWAWTTWSRTLAQYGVATAIKIDTTKWIISWTNLT